MAAIATMAAPPTTATTSQEYNEWTQQIERTLTKCHHISTHLTNQTDLYNELCTLCHQLQQSPSSVTFGSSPSIPNNNNNVQSQSNLFQSWAKSILELEVVRMEDSSEMEQRVHDQLWECWRILGVRPSFLAAMDLLMEATNSSGSSLEVIERVPGGQEDSRVGSRRRSKPSQAAVISSLHTIRRLVLELPSNQSLIETDPHTRKDTAAKPYLTTLMEEFHSSIPIHPLDESIAVPEGGVSLSSRRPQQAAIELVNGLIRLPTRIAAAAHTSKLTLPLWATRNKLGPRLIVCCLYAACSCSCSTGAVSNRDAPRLVEEGRELFETSLEDRSVQEWVLATLVQQMVHSNRTKEVASGFHHFWMEYCDQQEENEQDRVPITKALSKMLHFAFQTIPSPREAAALLRAILVHSVQQVEIYPTSMTSLEVNRICKEYCMDYLEDACLDVLQSSSMVREAFLHLVILSPSPSGDTGEQRLLTKCVVLLLALCVPCNDEEDSDDDSTDDDELFSENNKDEKSRKGQMKQRNTEEEHVILLKQLLLVAKIWCEPFFTTQTDQKQQRHVTEFILDGMDFMEIKGKGIEQQNVMMELTHGVTNRLKVSDESVRIDGMKVAEKMAPILGESLKFDELDGLRDEAVEDNSGDDHKEETASNGRVSDSGSQIKGKKGKKKRRRKDKGRPKIDPEEEYHSYSDEDSSSCSDSDDSSISNQSMDSIWDEDDLVKYDISDNEEDLQIVKKPTYLLECLEHLRTKDEEQEILCHKVALEELPSIVRRMPTNLPEYSMFLARELLHYENKFDSDHLVQCRWEGLLALTVCEPATTLQFLTQEIFGDVSQGIRLEVLDVMKEASAELSGALELEDRRQARL